MPQLGHALKTRSSDILGLGSAEIPTAWDTVTIVSRLEYSPLSVIQVSKFLTPDVSVRSCFEVFSGWFILFPCLSAGLESGSGFGFCPGYGPSVSSRFASVPPSKLGLSPDGR